MNNPYLYDHSLTDRQNTNALNNFEMRCRIIDLLEELNERITPQPKEIDIVDLLVKKMREL